MTETQKPKRNRKKPGRCRTCLGDLRVDGTCPYRCPPKEAFGRRPKVMGGGK